MKKTDKGEELNNLIIKPSISSVFFFSVVNVIIVILLIFGISKLIVYLAGENPLYALVDILSLTGIIRGGAELVSVITNTIIFILIILSSAYLLFSIIRVNNLSLELEEDHLIYNYGILLKRNERIKYDNVVKVKYKNFIFGLGKIIIEIYEADKTIEIPFVSNVKENFEILRSSIKEGLKRELKEEIKKKSEGKLPEFNINEIIEMLTNENPTSNDIINTFKNISRVQPITKETRDVFKLILFELVKRRIVGRDTMREIIRELREQNLITKEDIADIVELRFAIEESIY
ncbi:MAG: PH domain-containing protein [Candidatus Woesearchaeota archaeon]